MFFQNYFNVFERMLSSKVDAYHLWALRKSNSYYVKMKDTVQVREAFVS